MLRLLRPGILSIGWIVIALLIVGCQEDVLSASTPPAADPPSDLFGARQLPAPPGATVTINSDLNGDVQVIAFPADEVALDYVMTGWGSTENDAAAEAASNLTVTLEPAANGVLIWARLNNDPGQVPNPQNSVQLHVRVPQSSHVVVESVLGNVTVLGAVQSASVHTGGGDIVARGATGPLRLITNHGSIVADERSPQPVRLELRTTGGNITIFALMATVVAHTTNGSIRFVGTLGEADANQPESAQSEFKTSGNGAVVVALPDTLTYQFRAAGSARVLADFAPEVEPCGLLDSPTGEYDLRMRQTAGYFGRIEATGAITPTNYLEGTLGQGVFFFHTDHKLITIYDPSNHPPREKAREKGAPTSGMIGYCGRFNDANVKDVKTFFTVQTGSGDIWIHQIKMQK